MSEDVKARVELDVGKAGVVRQASKPKERPTETLAILSRADA